MTPRIRQILFETLYRNKYLYRFASTVPFAGQWRVWQRQVLPRLRGYDTLELGCGLGDLLADMLETGYACQAIEHSPQMVEAARETLRKRKLGIPGLILQGRAQALPFSDSTFDNVVSTFPSEYIYDPDTIAEIERVLRPGGRLIVIEGANLLPIGFFQPLLLLLQMLVYGPSTLINPRQKRNPNNQTKYSSQQPSSAKNILPVNRETATDITIEVVENAKFGRHIPLEKFSLRRRSEVVRSRRWEVYITIGEKVES
jgi:ubiquinone/menaquinone biosynthesis C-methylase UbiE